MKTDPQKEDKSTKTIIEEEDDDEEEEKFIGKTSALSLRRASKTIVVKNSKDQAKSVLMREGVKRGEPVSLSPA